MYKHKHTHRKPDPLMLLVILVSLAVMMTSAAAATGSNSRAPGLSDILDGEVMVAPVGRHGAGLHLTYQSNPYLYEAAKKNSVSTQKYAPSPTVFLSVRVPW